MSRSHWFWYVNLIFLISWFKIRYVHQVICKIKAIFRDISWTDLLLGFNFCSVGGMACIPYASCIVYRSHQCCPVEETGTHLWSFLLVSILQNFVCMRWSLCPVEPHYKVPQLSPLFNSNTKSFSSCCCFVTFSGDKSLLNFLGGIFDLKVQFPSRSADYF